MNLLSSRLAAASLFILLASLTPLSATRTSRSAAAPPVTLTDDGSSWHVGNGFVELTIDKKEAVVSHLSTPGGPEMLNSRYDGYADINGGPGGEGKAGYDRLGHHTPVLAEVARSTPEIADLVLRTDGGIPAKGIPLGSELHYIVRRGVPGFYTYWLLWHDLKAPKVGLGQSRTVLRLARAVFDRFRISDDRQGAFPTPEELKLGHGVYDATMQLADGTYRTKYANSAPISEQDVYGVYSTATRTGLWLVKPSNEFMNGTPDRRELTIHEEAPLLLNMGQAGHYIHDQDGDVEGNWSKLYGPVFYYVTRGEDFDAAWRDARRRVAIERAQWPYAWAHPKAVPDAYPLVRGTVTGRIAVSGGKPAAGAWAVLGAATPELQRQAVNTYEFWTKAGADGRFTLPKVRPGVYTLWVYQPGVFGEVHKDGIVVRAGGTTNAGIMPLTPVTNGRLLWQVGTPDRSAGEFRHGKETRQVYLIHEYPKDFPSDVHYVIGKSNPATDWNYCQPGGHPWTVAFDLPAAPARDAVLTLAVSDSGYSPSARIAVAVNGQAAGEAAFDGGANCLYRLGNTGCYQFRTVAIPTATLKAGRNLLTLTLPSQKMWAMYDFVRLEEKAVR